MHRIIGVVVVLGIGVLSGCRDAPSPSPAGGDEWSGTIDTLETGRVVVRNPGATGSRAGDAWQLRERFRLGTLGGDGPELFGQIGDIELGPGGELYVLDSQAHEVRVFGPDGAHVRTFGRSGEGPGELNRPAGMALDADGILWIMNWGNARYSGFDPGTGELVTEKRRRASFTVMPWPGEFDPSGRLLDTGLGGNGEPVILLLDSAFVPQDTLELPRPDERHQVLFTRGDVAVMSVMVPFAPQPSWAPHPDGGIVVGEGDAYRVHRIDFHGDTTRTIEVLRAPVPVTSAERDSALAEFAEIGRSAGGATPDQQPRVPSNKPAHGAIFVDHTGRVWVRAAAGSGQGAVWDVLGRDGRMIGQVSIATSPGFLAPSLREDRLAVATSVDGIPTIIVYELGGLVGNAE